MTKLLIAIIVAAGLIWWLEVPAMLKKKQKKELRVFCVLLLLGTAAGIAKALKGAVPNPLDWITFVFQPAADALMKILG